MKSNIVRFGVAMEADLLAELDALVAVRGGTRSEILRDLVRGEVRRVASRRAVPAVGTLTLVYDHHVRDLSERLTEMQHDLGEQVRSTLHIHLDHDNCLEVIVLEGRADQLHGVADRLVATKGVKHGGLEIYAQKTATKHAHSKSPRGPSKKHAHG